MESAVASCVRFGFATITSHWIGGQLAGSRLRLPHLTGYLLGGFISGPAVINLVTEHTLQQLLFLNSVALAAIAFSAGTELYFPDIKPHLSLIISQMGTICFTTVIVCAASVMAVRPWVPYINTVNISCQWQMALLCGSIMIARSPSSALSLIQSLFAKGELTTFCMSITVVSDAALLVVFAVVSSLATAECVGAGIDAWALLSLCVSVFGSILAGYLIGKLIVVAMWLPLLASRVKGLVILAAGSMVFLGSRYLERISRVSFHHPVRVESLLVCIAASCFACHATTKRRMLSMILKKTSVLAFLPFFTLTGASFNIRNIWPILPLSAILFFSRLIAIWLGSWIGLGCINHNNVEKSKSWALLWMTLTTQAGAAIGLANEVAHSFTPWGPSFADAVTVVVILNQITGPFIFRYALRRAGEDRSPKVWLDRDVAVFGVNRAAMSISARLCQSGCRVRVVRTDGVSAELAQTHIQTVLDHLNRHETEQKFQLYLAPDALPSASEYVNICCCLDESCTRHPVDLDYCPPDDDCDGGQDYHHHSESARDLLLPNRSAGGDTDFESLILRLVPIKCAAVVMSFDDDDTTLRACDIITTFVPRLVPRIVAVINTAKAAALLANLGVVVVHAQAALADVVTALSLTHSSEAVMILPAGKLSVRSVKNLIQPIDLDGSEDELFAFVETGGREKALSTDEWAVPMTIPKGRVAPPSDWTCFRQEMRRDQAGPTRRPAAHPQWISLG